VHESKIWYCVKNIVLKSVVRKYFDGIKIWVYEGQVTFSNTCTIMKSDSKCDRNGLIAIWKGFRMQRFESNWMLHEVYISLLPRSKDRFSAFVDKGSIKWAGRTHVSVHVSVYLHSPFHRLRFGHCAWHITSVKRGMDVFAFAFVFRGFTKMYRLLIYKERGSSSKKRIEPLRYACFSKFVYRVSDV
jgi:hypothetical protein